MKIETIKKRIEITKRIREFFSQKNFLEVETPILSPDLIPEINIEVFKTEFIDPYRGKTELYLTPSPEIWIKKLLAEKYGSIFEITKCFRNCEQIGKLHNPEFTMLEWYKINADYIHSMDLTEELFRTLYSLIPGKTAAPTFLRMSMQEVFMKYAKINLAECLISKTLFLEAEAAGLSPGKEDTNEELFNRIFLSLIEPELPQEIPLFLYNYPQIIPSLSKKISGTPWTERWELYAGGMELANCYSEETDKDEIRLYFEKESKLKQNGIIPYKTDNYYADIFSKEYPDCSGVAMGIDRLIMFLTGIDSINGVIFFPLSDIVKNK